MTSHCPYCKSERYVNEDGGVICDRCGATFLTEENTQDPRTFAKSHFGYDRSPVAKTFCEERA